MAVLIILILLLVAGGVAGTVHAVRSDGYGSRPDRTDRFAPTRPI